MPRLLFWSDVFWPYIGGPEVAGAALVRALQQRGYEVLVVTSHGSLNLPDEDAYEGIPVRRFSFYSALAERDIGQVAAIHQELSRLKRHLRPNLVHINFLGPGAIFHCQTAPAHPAPLVVTLRGMLPDRVLQPGSGYTFAFRSADWITANAEAALEQARRHVPGIIPRSSVIYDGLDAPATTRTSPPFDALRLLCIGRLSPEKGFDVALAAFATLADRFPSARLVVAGDGPERASLERQAARLGIAGAVDFVGWVAPERVRALMATVTLVVMPSWTEALPQVAIEAAQMERPVVGTAVGGVPEVVVDGKTGLLVEPGDSAALAGAVASLLQHPKRARAMAAAARRRADDVFGLDRWVDAYDALYRRLIEESARAASD